MLPDHPVCQQHELGEKDVRPGKFVSSAIHFASVCAVKAVIMDNTLDLSLPITVPKLAKRHCVGHRCSSGSTSLVSLDLSCSATSTIGSAGDFRQPVSLVKPFLVMYQSRMNPSLNDIFPLQI